MADKVISVDADSIRQAAAKVDSSASEIGNQLQKFQSIIEDLNKTWSSDVKTKFFTSYDKDLKALQNMLDQYQEVAKGLIDIANDMEKDEQDIKNKIMQAAKNMD